jgi:DNA invertase Pin-like site-specific DNA recombinase
MPLIGYARVSTDEQDTSAQLGELQRVGCATIFEDRASGGSRSRPKLASALAAVGQGDTLVVVRIDRLARSLSHLLEMVEGLRAKGAYFRSINDPIDTSSPQGMLMTQMLGAFAEFERALIRGRTLASKRQLPAALSREIRKCAPGIRQQSMPCVTP